MTTTARYARHELIPEWSQSRLSTAFVVVVGVGAVGSEVARLLALAGVGHLVLCDPDTVEESNLSRGALYEPRDVGRPKAGVAAEVLRERHPEIVVAPRMADLRHGVGLAELRAADLVASCLDSVTDRIALAGRCNLVGAGMLDAGTHAWGGEVRHYPAGGACYACGCTAAERALSSWHVACADPPGHFGASAAVSALSASWQATVALRLLFGLAAPAGAVRLDPTTGQSHAVALRRDPDCPCHERLDADAVTRPGVSVGAPVADLLALIEPGERALAWGPIVPGDPLASPRLSDADPQRRLEELGIPPGEILPVVRTAGEVRYLELEKEARG